MLKCSVWMISIYVVKKVVHTGDGIEIVLQVYVSMAHRVFDTKHQYIEK